MNTTITRLATTSLVVRIIAGCAPASTSPSPSPAAVPVAIRTARPRRPLAPDRVGDPGPIAAGRRRHGTARLGQGRRGQGGWR